MSGQWKPGDVALVLRVGKWVPAVKGRTDWWITAWGGGSYEDSDIRPLLVIDPEDREQVERLTEAYSKQRRLITDDGDGRVNDMQAALRSLAQPEDPEPQGLGAVVRDGRGREWVRADNADTTTPWRLNTYDSDWRPWANLPRPLTVLSQGWTEEQA